MKSKVLVSSILTIALCLSLIAGSTFALFTDSTDMNIAITSGDVEVAANIAIAGIYSAEGSGDVFEDKYLVDEYDSYYKHADKNFGNFTNGGTAVVDGNVLKMDRVTPGDKVAATVTIKNDGDVAMIYRYKIVSNNTKLANGMVITLDTPDGEATPYEGFASFTSYWSDPVLPGAVLTHNLSVELPVYAGNEYESGSVEYAIAVEAVQSNAVTSEADTPYDASFVVTTAAELQDALNNVGGNYYIYVANDLEGDVTLKQNPTTQFTINGNGHKFAGAITIDGGSTLDRNAGTAVTIKNFYFKTAGSPSANDAYIRLGDGTNATRYTGNVTVENCSFGGSDQKAVGIKSATGGDWDLTVKGCVANVGTHSLLQLANVEKGLEILDCRVYSKNGASLGASLEATIDGCIFYNLGYNVRFGSNAAANADEKFFTISNSVLNSACDDGDASIMFRGNSVYSTLNVYNTTINASKAYAGIVSGKTTVIADVYEAADLDAALAVVPEGGVVSIGGDVDYGTITLGALKKGITIKAADGANAEVVFATDANTVLEDVTLSGFAFDQDASANVVLGLNISKEATINNLTVENCTFTGVNAKNGWGIKGENANATIVIKGCTFSNMGYPVISQGSPSTFKSLTIDGCTFKNLKSWAIMPQYGNFTGELVITNNTFDGCANGIAKTGTFVEGSKFVFSGNTIINCGPHPYQNIFRVNINSNATYVIENNVAGADVNSLVDWVPGEAQGIKIIP